MLSACFQSIVSCLPSDVEFYVHTVDDKYASFATLLSPKRVTKQIDSPVSERRVYHNQYQPSFHSVQSQLRTWHTETAAWNNYVSSGDSHDLLFRLRADLILIGKLDHLKADTGVVYVLPHGSWGGVNVNFSYGTPSSMELVFNKLSVLDEYIDSGGIFHAEKFQKWALRHNTIQFTKVWAPILRPNFIVDGPYYSPNWGDPVVEGIDEIEKIVEIIGPDTPYHVLPVSSQYFNDFSYRSL
jgi:hypothetical protein